MAGKRITVKGLILSFPQNLWVPGIPTTSTGTPKPAYNCQLLADYDSAAKAQIDAAIEEIAKAEWKDDWKAILDSIEGNPNRMCWIDGKKRPKYNGYAGRWALSVKRYEADGAPVYLDRSKKPILQSSGLLYGGAIVNVVLDVWTYKKPSAGISSTLNIIQFAGHGESLGGAAPVSEHDFEGLDFDDEESDDDLESMV